MKYLQFYLRNTSSFQRETNDLKENSLYFTINTLILYTLNWLFYFIEKRPGHKNPIQYLFFWGVGWHLPLLYRSVYYAHISVKLTSTLGRKSNVF